MALNASFFTRTSYDDKAYKDKLTESTSPFEYMTSEDKIHKCGGCLTTLGPRSGYGGYGVSTFSGDVVAPSQANVDVESILSNRNVKLSTTKRGKVNPINVTKFKTQHAPVCNDYLDYQHTRMTDPAMFYRGAPINRFYDLDRDPQANIFYDFAVDTKLEAKDNYVPTVPNTKYLRY